MFIRSCDVYMLLHLSQMVYTNGEVYEGEWRNGLKWGKGIMMYRSGDLYLGMFKNDKRHGTGVFKLASGEGAY